MQIRKYFTKKKIIWTLVILLIAGPIVYKIFKPKNNSANILTEIVKKQNLKQTVLATGQVVSQTDLSLSFKVSGFVARVFVKEGDEVKQGQILANLEQKDQIASLTSARGAFAQAQANHKKVLAGASNEEIIVSQKAVDAAEVTLQNAKESLNNVRAQQETAVKNAYSALLNSGLEAEPGPANVGSATVSISGTYTDTLQGEYKVKIYSGGLGKRFQVSGLGQGDGEVKTISVPLGDKGLYISFSGTVYNDDEWTVSIPNTSASSYVANYNAYQTSLKTQSTAVDSAQATVRNAEIALAQAKAALDLKRAEARPAELDSARAQILSAEGQVLAAGASLENTIIRAPSAGTITAVEVKNGELATAQKPSIVLQDVSNLHIEANISEANIALVREGQSVEVTFDALGPDRIFKAWVLSVNPASTVVSGVVNYKVIVSLEKLNEINPVRDNPDPNRDATALLAQWISNGVKPGMTANLTILAGEKDGVLAIPQRAVIQNGKKQVRVIDDAKKKTFHEVEVTTGMEADGGLVEAVSGLNEGQEVVTFIKK